jgi:hypothetical protein
MPIGTRYLDDVAALLKRVGLVSPKVGKARRKATKQIILSPRPSRFRKALTDVAGLFSSALDDFFLHFQTAYLKVDWYKVLEAENAAFHAHAASMCAAIGSEFGQSAERAMKLLMLEAHHFFPKTLARDFPLLGFFLGPDTMFPSVNLTAAIEHRGVAKFLRQLYAAFPGKIGQMKPPKNPVSAKGLTASLNEVIATVRAGLPASPRPTLAAEQAATRQMLEAIRAVYKRDMPDVLKLRDPNGVALEEWIDNAIKAVDDYAGPWP